MSKKKVNYRAQRGLPLPQKTIQKVQHLLSKRHGKYHQSYQQIADQIGCAKSTIYRIHKIDMSVRTQKERSSRRAQNRLLSIEQERIVCGWILHRTITYKSSTTKKIRSFILQNFNTNVSACWITRFLQRYDFTLRSAQPIKAQITKEKSFKDAIAFLDRVKAFKKQPGQIACMDKTGVYTDVAGIKHAGPRGR